MAKLLSQDHFEVTNGENILYLNSLAVQAKAEGKKIKNATIGMLYDEKGALADFKIVNDIIKSCDDEPTKIYGSINGGLKFSNSVKSWVFDNVNLERVHSHIVATPGATGALALAMRNYCDRGQEILVPSIRWSNYDSIAFQAGLKIREYNLFNSNDELDLDSLKHAIDVSCKKFGRAFVLMNDPCQNPTGYTLKIEEWKELITYLKEKSKNYPVILLDDIAYLNYSKDSYDEVFNLMLDNLTNNFMVLITFSASKTLSIYGLRGGALIGLANSEENINDFRKSCEGTCRALWSCPSSTAVKVISDSFDLKETRDNIRKELDNYRDILLERAKLFLEEADTVGLMCYPYQSGFFILIPCENNKKISDRLISENIYIVPMCGGLRLSLSSITKKEVKGIARAIKKAMK